MGQALRLTARRRWPLRVGDVFRQPHDFERTSPLFHAPEEAALLERRDQPVDARFGAQIERVLHLVKGRRNARFAHTLMDEHEQFVLFARQHRFSLPLLGMACESGAEQTRNMENCSTLVPIAGQRSRCGVQTSSSGSTSTRSPMVTAGACGARTIRQSAAAKALCMEESCTANGSAHHSPSRNARPARR